MRTIFRPVFILLLALAAGATAASPASPPPSFSTAPWPAAKPIRWVIAYPAGGGSDFLARTLAPQLSRQLGQTVVVDNRPGAAGIIGTDHAAKSPPDGYTLLTGDNGAMVFNEALYRKLPYAAADLAPVGFMARFPLVLVANPDAGFANARELLAAIRRSPGKLAYASPGVGSPHHLAMELLKHRAGLEVVHVPYRGTAPAVQDVIGGVVPLMVLDTAAGLAQIRGGKVRALAVLSGGRLAALPEVPTLEELGVKDADVSAWQALFVPRGTPVEIVERLETELAKALALPSIRQRLNDFGLEVAPSDGKTLAAFLRKETTAWHALIKARALTAE